MIERRFLTPDGIEIAADVGGWEGGPTIILMHGGGQTRHSWGGAMRRLIAEGYCVVNIDLRGHGDSEWPIEPDYRVENFASDLKAVRSTIDGPVAFVGASMGGLTGFFAIGDGDAGTADALVMVDIVLQPAAIGRQRFSNFIGAHREGFTNIEEAADAVAAYNPRRQRPADISGLMKNLREAKNGRLYWHWDPRVFAARPDEGPHPEFVERLFSVANNVRVPTLLVRGLRSDMIDDLGVAEMKELIPQLEIHDVAGAGHMVAGDRNDAFNDGIVTFLHRHLPAKAIARKPN